MSNESKELKKSWEKTIRDRLNNKAKDENYIEESEIFNEIFGENRGNQATNNVNEIINRQVNQAENEKIVHDILWKLCLEGKLRPLRHIDQQPNAGYRIIRD